MNLYSSSVSQVPDNPPLTPESGLAYVGQQVQLQGSPAPMLTSVTWTYDSSAPTDVVGNGFVGNVRVVGTPQPVPSSGDPISFYWVSAGVPGGIRHVRMNVSVSNVTGPLFADVYYPIGTPSPSVSYSVPANVQVGNDTVGAQPIGCPTPFTTFTALHLGIACGPTPTPKPGIVMKYSATVPSFGAGQLGVAQLVTETFSGTLRNGTKVQATSGPGADLDTNFPYLNYAFSPGITATLPDSPFYNLQISGCTSITEAESFTDYFMYEPTATSSRRSIWVSDFVAVWPKWSGTANVNSKGQWSLAGGSVNPKPTPSPPTSSMPSWPANITSFTPPC
jgi:hypothetical protein